MNKEKIFNKENFLCVLLLPVLVFLHGRLECFFADAWDIKGVGIPVAAALLAVLGTCIFFRKQIFDFVSSSAYGFSNQAVLIYILAVLTLFKYRHIFVYTYGGGRVSVLGAGILLGFFVLVAMKGAEYVIRALSHTKISKSDVIFIVFLYACLNVQLYIYCRNMSHIFVWDNAGYFLMADRLNSIFPSGEYFKHVFYSVAETDYNYVILFFASVFRKLFGSSRYVFLLSIVNMYLAPFLILLHFVSKRFLKTNIFHSVCAVLAFTMLIAISNIGFIDVGGIIFALLAVVLFMYSDKCEASLLSGICLAICVLMRRWFSFFALSFAITCFLYEVPRKKCLKSFMVLAGFGFMLVFFFQNFVTDKLMADYADLYSAYDLGIKTDYFITIRYFGIVLLLSLMAYGVYTQVRSKKLALTPQMFLVVQSILCFFIFTRVQTHGQQHLLLYAAPLCLLFMMLAGEIKKKSALAVILALSTVQTVNPFIPREQPSAAAEIKSHALFPNFSVYPPNDINPDDILRITEYLDREIGEKGKTACILASSFRLNYETIMNAEMSLSVKKKSDINRAEYFLQISDVDKRDGFADRMLTADYVLVPDRLQVHLSPDDQRVIVVPYEQITKGVGIGTAYRKTDTVFYLAGETINVYERIREVTPEEQEQLVDNIFRKE